ncbi:MAG: formylmethanofuran dehydrogenase subunit E family protein [Acidobacteriota bacterium]|jgi:formylmethanofuran dehydrogenase subunit E|nr:formylmethanofuran dehydrogenase subunit E family protein [Acidobacteriota bacterium]
MNKRVLPLAGFEKKIAAFREKPAPGLIIGGYMVDEITKNLPKDRFYDVICESIKCLPDAVQLLTPCSVGNGWLRILKIGRFAMTFFDKETGEGIRAYLDTEKLKKYPPINEWFFKLTPKREQDSEKLMASIRSAGGAIISLQKVKVDTDITKKKKDHKVAVCAKCHEAYPATEDGNLCKVCNGKISYYDFSGE